MRHLTNNIFNCISLFWNPAHAQNKLPRGSSRLRGFTLIEVMIVVLIIGIISSVAILRINGPTSKKAESLAKRLEVIFSYAQEEAILQSTVLGVSFSQSQYMFWSFEIPSSADENSTKPHWQLLSSNRIFKTSDIPKNLQISLEVSGENVNIPLNQAPSTPSILFYPSGEMTPFIFTVKNARQRNYYQLTGTYSGEMHVVRGE